MKNERSQNVSRSPSFAFGFFCRGPAYPGARSAPPQCSAWDFNANSKLLSRAPRRQTSTRAWRSMASTATLELLRCSNAIRMRLSLDKQAILALAQSFDLLLLRPQPAIGSFVRPLPINARNSGSCSPHELASVFDWCNPDDSRAAVTVSDAFTAGLVICR